MAESHIGNNESRMEKDHTVFMAGEKGHEGHGHKEEYKGLKFAECHSKKRTYKEQLDLHSIFTELKK
jgi:hypothetical protein